MAAIAGCAIDKRYYASKKHSTDNNDIGAVLGQPGMRYSAAL